ncbi:MAG TPA: DUF1501 domain-containing protein [Candidatus Saccharimonadales bacterium]|nr:DUF1501 domain-containing protein [Candidatus Saccharimonadales bacterium]
MPQPSPSSSRPRNLCAGTRREFLWQAGAGFAGLALTALLDQDGFFQGPAAAAVPAVSLGTVRPPHQPLRAKACIFLFMYGGPSQMDLFDYKPELQKRDGQSVDMEIRRRSVQSSKLLASRRTWAQHGQSGQWCSDAFPLLSRKMDKLAVIKSLYADSFAHGSAMLQMNSGRVIQGYPSLGSWLSYGLGTLNQDLPGYVVMLDPRGGPISGAANWSSGFMPATFQGTVFRASGQPILNLDSASGMEPERQRQLIQTANALNAEHLARHPGHSELQARIASYELAFQLQHAAPEALDLTQESEATRQLYGLNAPKPEHPLALGPAPFGRQCLIARRLVERGVRFVQIYHGGGHQQQNWDAHNGVEENLQIHCPEIDQPIHALLTDLEQRGLLDETLVIWGGEFGRQPVVQGGSNGRDHNPKGFTYFLAGAGVKGGISYGETDELGHQAVVNRHHLRDLHATVLHLMGLDYRKLTYFYGGLNQKLTGVVDPEIIQGILA